VIGLGIEAIALVRRILPHARIVVTFHEYLAICANHGQMIKPAKRQLCHAASPASCNSCFPDRSPAQFFSREQHLKNHLLLADAFVSPSRFLLDRYSAWGLPAERFRVIENGVEGTPAPPRPLRGGGRRDRFGFFGQITEFKGLHIVLDAIGQLNDELWGDATLSVFGGNLEYQPEVFRDRFAKLMIGAGPRARFFGSYRQQDLAALMADVDWVIMPSIWWENSPVVIQEAFLHRRPLLVSGIGGMAEKVRPEIDGLHFRAGSPESLADAMTRALSEPGLWPRLSQAAPIPPDAAAMAAEHLALYRDIGASAEPAAIVRLLEHAA
jgi:glycosyltransferase involved in cell wall biosynthesis